ncbi:MAG: hypothetical protein AVDCRST_MAG67-3356, partial [uncultured Solirubrobacteraceae bacterium]
DGTRPHRSRLVAGKPRVRHHRVCARLVLGPDRPRDGDEDPARARQAAGAGQAARAPRARRPRRHRGARDHAARRRLAEPRPGGPARAVHDGPRAALHGPGHRRGLPRPAARPVVLRAPPDRHEALALAAPLDAARVRLERDPHARRGDRCLDGLAAGDPARHRRADPVLDPAALAARHARGSRPTAGGISADSRRCPSRREHTSDGGDDM